MLELRPKKTQVLLRPYAAPAEKSRAFQYSQSADMQRRMLKRLISILTETSVLAAAGNATAEDQKPVGQVRPVAHLEIASMMGRWYEVARFPNSIQRNCQAGASDWIRTSADAFAVTQSCHKGTPDGPLAEWKAKARVADPSTTATTCG